MLDLEHGERRRWVEEISRINQRMNEAPPELPDSALARLKTRT